MAGYEDQTMEIENTTFGTITMDGKTYEHDVVVRLSGEVVKRNKKLSKKYTAPRISPQKTKRSLSSKRGASSSLLARAKLAMASIAGSRNLFREKELQGSVAADPRGDPCVQQVNGKKDWAFSRDLLNWEGSFLLPAQYSLLLSGLKAARHAPADVFAPPGGRRGDCIWALTR